MNREKIDLDEWYNLISQSYLAPPVIYKEKVLPGFPSDTIQENTTGQFGVATLKEAFIFYKDVIANCEALGTPIMENNKILDSGVGWGRIARFFLRELALDNIYGVDVMPEFVEICQETFQSNNFSSCQSHPPTSFPNSHFNFIVGYSVFSHLSEDACLAWMKEFSRILEPGGIVALTTRGRPFFDFCESQKKTKEGFYLTLKKLFNKNKPSGYLEALGMLFEDFDAARKKYDRGGFVHSNIEGVDGGGSLNKTFYGETFISEVYARNSYAPFLELKKFMFDPSYQSHPIMFFQKN